MPPPTTTTLVLVALATYYVAVTLARLHGPLGLAEAMRQHVLRWRGFTPVILEGHTEPVWKRALPSGYVQSTSDDWIASGVRCPLCLSLYIAPVMLALASSSTPGWWAVAALGLAGAASALFSGTS